VGSARFPRRSTILTLIGSTLTATNARDDSSLSCFSRTWRHGDLETWRLGEGEKGRRGEGEKGVGCHLSTSMLVKHHTLNLHGSLLNAVKIRLR
jgi:hypothetical protein